MLILEYFSLRASMLTSSKKEIKAADSDLFVQNIIATEMICFGTKRNLEQVLFEYQRHFEICY